MQTNYKYTRNLSIKNYHGGSRYSSGLENEGNWIQRTQYSLSFQQTPNGDMSIYSLKAESGIQHAQFQPTYRPNILTPNFWSSADMQLKTVPNV
jgi:hypothetical protein